MQITIREGLKNPEESVTFSALRGGGDGWRSHSLGDLFATQKPFVCLKEARKQTLNFDVAQGWFVGLLKSKKSWPSGKFTPITCYFNTLQYGFK